MALRGDEHEFMNLREWDRRARLIRENPTSRRFSASYVGSFREDHHKSSSRTYLNSISSTASSPGYTLKDEIDPSTYSFTNALKALQAKTMFNNREWLTQEGFALNSKWNEAEKYICNPVSGEVPMECLSSKTLSARSFRNLTTTMSAPLHYPDPNPLMNNIGQNKPNDNSNVKVIHEDLYAPDPVLVRAEKKVVGLKRDVGIQSTSVDLSSGSPSPAKTPPIMERSLKRHVEANDSPVEFNLKLEGQQEDLKLEDKEKEGDKQEMSKEEAVEKQEVSNTEGEETEEKQEMRSIKEGEGEEKQEMSDEEEEEEEEMKKQKKRGGSGCFSWRRSRQRQARKSKYIFPICVPHLVKGC
ncbi:myelin transcription factor 1 isoform X1 [Brassica rapa]|uniref:myelin transcription factor 1 isoform X1 n=1 Tax=Brassica campestris TaxID=3711 RepID=UPI0004F1AD41|nr:myelin transcription factor 1 isoform X1 [Brassica rapa]